MNDLNMLLSCFREKMPASRNAEKNRKREERANETPEQKEERLQKNRDRFIIHSSGCFEFDLCSLGILFMTDECGIFSSFFVSFDFLIT